MVIEEVLALCPGLDLGLVELGPGSAAAQVMRGAGDGRGDGRGDGDGHVDGHGDGDWADEGRAGRAPGSRGGRGSGGSTGA
jgi:hypothetical protein